MRLRKAQSAIEYLMTYGWMLLVVAVVGGAVFSIVSGQNIDSVSGFDSSHILVSDFGITSSSLQMVVEGGSQSITLNQITISDSEDEIVIPMEDNVDFRNSRVLNIPHITESSETKTIDVELSYDTENLENITATGAVTGNLELDQSLIGYWTLSENQANSTHVFDVSGNNNHGEIIGSPSWDKNRKKDPVRFHGDESIVIPHSEDFDAFDGDFTVIHWGSSFENNRHGKVLKKERVFSDSRPGWAFGPAGSPQELYFTKSEGDDDDNRMNMDLPREHELTFIAGVVEGEEITGYLNETQVESETYSGDFNSNNPIVIGSENVEQRFLNGTIGNVMIYDRALTDEEIRSIYRNPPLVLN